MERRRYCLCSNLCCAIQGDYPSVGMGAIRSGLENLDAETPQDKRILGDIRLAFELFGICGEGKRISAEALLTFANRWILILTTLTY
mgnify:CR=1 FL=1